MPAVHDIWCVRMTFALMLISMKSEDMTSDWMAVASVDAIRSTRKSIAITLRACTVVSRMASASVEASG